MTIPGMTGDTDPDNPVNALPAWEFPIGAALTVAYGSNERPYCTLGNLYRVLGWLTGDCPGADHINSEIARCRDHVAVQLPTELRVVDPPPTALDEDDTAVMAWLGGIVNKYGATVALTALPGTPNNPTTPNEGTDDDEPAARADNA